MISYRSRAINLQVCSVDWVRHSWLAAVQDYALWYAVSIDIDISFISSFWFHCRQWRKYCCVQESTDIHYDRSMSKNSPPRVILLEKHKQMSCIKAVLQEEIQLIHKSTVFLTAIATKETYRRVCERLSMPELALIAASPCKTNIFHTGLQWKSKTDLWQHDKENLGTTILR